MKTKKAQPVPPSAPQRNYLQEPFPEWIQGTAEERFSAIYQNWFWGEPESVSGPGSSLAQTARIRSELPSLFKELHVKSLLDIPCGDFHWMSHVELGEIDYTGADIVPELVDRLRRRLAKPGRSFVRLDLTADPLPKVDLVLCRDCLVHLSYPDIRAAINNIRMSGSGYLLTTTFLQHRPNRDIQTGDWRPLDLQAEPFLFPSPIRLITEDCPERGYQDKSLGLWRTAALPVL